MGEIEQIRSFLADRLADPNSDMKNKAFRLARYRLDFPNVPIDDIYDLIDDICPDPDAFAMNFDEQVGRVASTDLYDTALQRSAVSTYIPEKLGKRAYKEGSINLRYVRIVRELALYVRPYTFFVDQKKLHKLGVHLVKFEKGMSEAVWKSSCEHQGTDILGKMKDVGLIKLIEKYRPKVSSNTYHWIEDLTEAELASLERTTPPWTRSVRSKVEVDDAPF